MAATRYDKNVFINCPFDDEYKPLFDAVVFAVHDCGFRVRCTFVVAWLKEHPWG